MEKILFVCHGNICRSPMAEFVMKDLVKKQGLENEFYINDIIPVYAFSKRNSEEKIDRYGTIIKTSLFYNEALFYKCKDGSLHFIHNNKDNK